MFLAIETTTDLFSVAVGDAEGPAALLKIPGRKHSDKLMPSIEHILKEAGVEASGLKAVSAGTGPGSFTGIRIGITCAVTYAQVLGIPAYGISSLDLAGRKERNPVIRAFRDKFYWAEYDKSGLRITPYSLIDENRRKQLGSGEAEADAAGILKEVAELFRNGVPGDWRKVEPIYVMETVYRTKKI